MNLCMIFLPIENIMAERYLYIPLVGFCILSAQLLSLIPKSGLMTFHYSLRRKALAQSPAPKATMTHQSPGEIPLSKIFWSTKNAVGEDMLPYSAKILRVACNCASESPNSSLTAFITFSPPDEMPSV